MASLLKMVPPELLAMASKFLGYGVVAGATFVKIPQVRSTGAAARKFL